MKFGIRFRTEVKCRGLSAGLQGGTTVYFEEHVQLKHVIDVLNDSREVESPSELIIDRTENGTQLKLNSQFENQEKVDLEKMAN